MSKILFGYSVGEWKTGTEPSGFSPHCRKGLGSSVMNLAENEFELISPAINMGYQLWNGLSFEPNVKDKQKLVARMGLSFVQGGKKKRKKKTVKVILSLTPKKYWNREKNQLNVILVPWAAGMVIWTASYLQLSYENRIQVQKVSWKLVMQFTNMVLLRKSTETQPQRTRNTTEMLYAQNCQGFRLNLDFIALVIYLES